MDPDTAAALRRWQHRTARPGQTPEAGRSRSTRARTAPRPPAVREPVPPRTHVLVDERRRVVITLPWDRPPITLNSRLGWAALHRHRVGAREAVEWLVREVVPFPGPVEVEIVRYLGTRAAADPDNLSATLKPVIDALCGARVIPADDAATVVRTSQRVVPADRDPLGAGHPRLLLVVDEARPGEPDHYGTTGETLT